jgi:D-alanine-D-alanine ligase
VPAALELVNLPYTGAGMRGMVIGNDRHLFTTLLEANDIPTPRYQFITRRGAHLDPNLGLPLIVKLNEGGGSVGIDNSAVKETLEAAQAKADEMIGAYRLPVIAEQFIDGPEITAALFDDGRRIHVYLAQKRFNFKPDGKHEFTSLESYSNPQSYTYQKVNHQLAGKIEPLARRAFSVLHLRDYGKFDIRVDEETGTPYFTDCNPNTAFGPNLGLPFTEVLDLYGIKFETVIASLMSKYAKKIYPA